ncbi:tubulin-like doman-containing protein [Halobellus rarus]|uniref:Tubulin-like doman-containing protein n=1 Tax=Halobellus rarus TaxID=1126237 RepID=A0ABD6CJG5_9EURY|nr:tubulin-like doman-containing protein [Halobellus rarus]
MPNGGIPLSPLEPQAVTVIGIGAGGCRMLEAVNDAVDRADPGPAFSSVAIDSRAQDLERLAPAGATSIHLEPPTTLLAKDRAEAGYLDESVELPPGGGTARQRALGRYYVDNAENVDSVVNGLAEVLDEASEQLADPSDTHHVWLLSSLGGGTGSGLVPLIAGLVDTLSPQADVFGIGSVPRLDMLADDPSPPAGEPSLYYNAYAALRELRALLGLDDADPYPLELELRSQPRSLVSDSITLEESPIGAYGVFGMDQAEVANGSYREAMNRTVANVIVDSTVETDLVAGRPAGGWTNDATLFSFDGAGFSAPIEEVREFYETAVELEGVDAESERIETRLPSVEDALDVLQSAESRPLETLLDEADDLPISRDVIKRVRNEVASLELPSPTDSGVDAAIESVKKEISVDESVDDVLAAYLVTQRVERRVDEELRSHPFSEEIEALTDEVRDRLDDPIPGENADPETRWERTLEPLLRQRQRLLERTIDDTLAVRLFHRREQQSKLERLRARYDRLRELRAEYERLRETSSLISERHEAAREDRWIEQERLEQEVEELREKRTELTDRRAQLEQRLDALDESLADPSSERYSTLPVEALENADPDQVLSADSLRDLVSADVVAAVAVADALEETVARLDETVCDRLRPVVDPVRYPQLALSVSDSDRDLIGMTDNAITVDGAELPDPTVLERFDDAYDVRHADSFSVHAVATYASIALENTSEFGTIHEWYTDPDRDVGDLFDRTGAEDRIPRCFAYPELLAAGASDE